MGARRNRILLTSEYLGPIKSCLVGAGIGLALSIASYGVVAAASPEHSYFTFENYGLIAVTGVLFALIGTIVGWGVSRFRLGSAKGAVLAGFLWPASVVILPFVLFTWMFIWTAVRGLQDSSDIKYYEVVPFLMVSWLYLIPLVIFFLPASILAGALIPWSIVSLSWWNADKLR